ncbi:MAG: transcriptional regulator [Candidatus Bathyarchaeota archaeon]|nr:MAG: transcriptional regulator [Candidatus Bathyarchaeota archaeon]
MVTLYKSLQGKSTRVLEKIANSLDQLNEKVDVLIELQKHSRGGIIDESLTDVLDVMTLLSLPDHLRKTAVTLCKLGQATAEEIAEQTRRARAVESGYLNQLVLMGFLKKERRGRKAYFYVEKEGSGEKPWEK